MNYNLSSLGSSSCKYFYCQCHANWSDRLSYKDNVGITAIILLSMYMYIDTCNNASLFSNAISHFSVFWHIEIVKRPIKIGNVPLK